MNLNYGRPTVYRRECLNTLTANYLKHFVLCSTVKSDCREDSPRGAHRVTFVNTTGIAHRVLESSGEKCVPVNKKWMVQLKFSWVCCTAARDGTSEEWNETDNFSQCTHKLGSWLRIIKFSSWFRHRLYAIVNFDHSKTRYYLRHYFFLLHTRGGGVVDVQVQMP